jgi:hypothetical protein
VVRGALVQSSDSSEGGAPWSGRFVERDLWTPVADVIGWLEARALWARFGL